jgi:methionyl-tRNA formyltransferase
MGTPEFAVPTLKAIYEKGYSVAGVVTAPDKPAGRGRKLKPSPVKQFAIENGLRFFQPDKLKNPDFISELKNLNPDLFVVVAFRMLPPEVWKIPKKGTFNLHASLLPQYRGAAPINHALINGEKITGLTTFFIDDKIDTGKILEQEKMTIGEDETFGELHDRMMAAGAKLVLSTITKIIRSETEVTDQSSLITDELSLKGAPKLSKEFCQVNWNKSMLEIFNFVRGLSPYPLAFTYLDNGDENPILVKLVKVEKVEKRHQLEIGKIETDNKTFLRVAVPDGLIQLNELQLMGKRRMTAKELLNGFKLTNGAKFDTSAHF